MYSIPLYKGNFWFWLKVVKHAIMTFSFFLKYTQKCTNRKRNTFQVILCIKIHKRLKCLPIFKHVNKIPYGSSYMSELILYLFNFSSLFLMENQVRGLEQKGKSVLLSLSKYICQFWHIPRFQTYFWM